MLRPNSLQRRFGILFGAKQRAPFNLGTKGESQRAGRRYVRPRRSQLYQSVPAPGASQTHGRRRVDGSRSGLGVASVRGPLCAFCAPGPARRDERFADSFSLLSPLTRHPPPPARAPYPAREAAHAYRTGSHARGAPWAATRQWQSFKYIHIYNPRYNRMSAHPVASQILHRHRRAPATYDMGTATTESTLHLQSSPLRPHQRGSIHRPVRAARSDQTHTIRCGVCASAACVVYAQDMLPYACATPRSDTCSALFVLTEPLIPHRVKAAVAVARRHHAWRQKGGDRNVRSPCSCSAEKRRLKGCELLSQLAQPRVQLVLNLRHVCGVLEAHAVLHRGSKRPTDPCPSYLPHPTCFESQQPIPHILICGLEQATICHGTSMRTQYGIQVLLELRSQAIHAPPRFRRTCAEDAPRVDENGAIRHSAHRDTSR